MKYYIDCEFDGHNGPMLSLAIVREDGSSIYMHVHNEATDPWVIENVVPILRQFPDDRVEWWSYIPENSLGGEVRQFLDDDEDITVIADSPVDIWRFCKALSTNSDGGWASIDYPKITFEVHDVDCYPTTLEGAVQHNAWWDAMALKEKLK